jgi:hypothetical protein
MVFNTTFSKLSVVSWQSAIEDLTVTIMENNNTITVPWLLL